jgi:uncharacterized C2H2 Zn-finger protein
MNEADCHHCATRVLHVRSGDPDVDPTNGLTHVEGHVFACPACGACFRRKRESSSWFSGYTFTRLPHADWVADALAEAVREQAPPAPSSARCPRCGARNAAGANEILTCARCGTDFKPLVG